MCSIVFGNGLPLNNAIHPLGPLLAHAAHLFGTGKLAVLVFAVAAGLVIVGIENALTVVYSFVTTSFEQKMILDFRGDMLQHARRLLLGETR